MKDRSDNTTQQLMNRTHMFTKQIDSFVDETKDDLKYAFDFMDSPRLADKYGIMVSSLASVSMVAIRDGLWKCGNYTIMDEIGNFDSAINCIEKDFINGFKEEIADINC